MSKESVHNESRTAVTGQSKESSKGRRAIKKTLQALRNGNSSLIEIKDFVIEDMDADRNLPLSPHLPDASIRTDSQDNVETDFVKVHKEPTFRNKAPKEETKILLIDESNNLMNGIREAENVELKENENDEEYEFKDAEDIIKIENGHKTYLLGLEGVAALRGVSVTIKKKEFICIFGTSGGGKTTLLNLIGTIDKPTKGNVYIDGKRIRNSTSDKTMASLRLNKLSFVFQTFNLIGSLTALENVELPMQLKGGLSRSQIKERAKELLDKVGLGERLNHFPKQLSGGEQQRVTIARALANDPEIMLLDEPTGDLDTKNTDIVMKILVDLNMRGITLIMVSHDLNLKNYAHRVIRISDGKMMGEEIISRKAREQHYKELCDRIDNPDKGKLSIREGADYLQSKNGEDMERELEERFPVRVINATSLRTEGDYKILRMVMQQRHNKQ